MSERPSTTALLDEVMAFVRRFVLLPGDHFYVAVALWVLHTHAIKAADSTPRLLAKSAEKESGKTRLLEVLEILVPGPLFTFNTSVAALFRIVSTRQTTVLIDEGDALWSPKAGQQAEDVRALVNAGHRRSAKVARAVAEGKKIKVEEFAVFAPVAIAAIGNLPDTVESRAIVIPMQRRRPDQSVEQFRQRWAVIDSGNVRDRLSEWAELYAAQLAESNPAMPETVTDRAAESWEPLLAIADLAGGAWPTRAREAAVAIVSGRVAEDQSLGVRLLADVKTVLDGDDRMSSAALAAALNTLEESGWGNWNSGRGITARDLAYRLKPYGLMPKVIRLADGTTPRGYLREWFFDPWSRYLRDAYPSAQRKKDEAPAAYALDFDFDDLLPRGEG